MKIARLIVLVPFCLILGLACEQGAEIDYDFESLSGLERRMGDHVEEYLLPSMAGLCIDHDETVLSAALGFRALCGRG